MCVDIVLSPISTQCTAIGLALTMFGILLRIKAYDKEMMMHVTEGIPSLRNRPVMYPAVYRERSLVKPVLIQNRSDS